jgi:hypothetical protein
MKSKQLTPEEIEKQVQPKPTDWRFRDLEGQRFNMVAVGRYCGRQGGHTLWECTCDCGKVYVTSKAVIVNPTNRSCGCHRDRVRGKSSITHGMTATAEYEIWCGIKKRCFNSNHRAYKDYGGRGITMLQRWADSFEEFLKDVGPRPLSDSEIDRYPDNNGNYEPGNVRWASPKEQANNRRSSRLITVNGKTKTLTQWGESSGLGWAVIKSRLDHGMPPDLAVCKPLRKGNYRRGKHQSAPEGADS